jgi:hypothetical protein
VLYVAGLVTAGGVVARAMSGTAGAALVVVGLLLLAVVAIRSRNRSADGTLDPGMGELYAGEGDLGVGGDGGGGGGGD